jgi:hypothetical protein
LNETRTALKEIYGYVFVLILFFEYRFFVLSTFPARSCHEAFGNTTALNWLGVLASFYEDASVFPAGLDPAAQGRRHYIRAGTETSY